MEDHRAGLRLHGAKAKTNQALSTTLQSVRNKAAERCQTNVAPQEAEKRVCIPDTYTYKTSLWLIRRLWGKGARAKRQRDKERQREAERHRDRETERHKDRETEKQRDRETECIGESLLMRCLCCLDLVVLKPKALVFTFLPTRVSKPFMVFQRSVHKKLRQC